MKAYFLLLFSSLLMYQPLTAQFATVRALEPLPVSANTADKPQSKVWFAKGKWWMVMPNEEGTFLWRLDDVRWTSILQLSPGLFAKADCKVVGDVVHVLLFRDENTSYLISVEYQAVSDTYVLWSRRDTRVPLEFDAGAETATLDIDSQGRMWIANDASNTINVRWSDAPYASFSLPITVASTINSDDLGGIISLPGKVGVLWSNQSSKKFGFKTHTDGQEPGDWSADEVPASQSAVDVGTGMADDHVNMAVASDGTLYCAVKTGFEKAGYPKIGLMIRRPGGSWDRLYEVAQSGTRPIVILNEVLGKVKVIYSASEQGGDILYQESSTTAIAFGVPQVLIPGTYNFATSAKANYDTDIVIMASNETTAVGVIGKDEPYVPSPEPLFTFIAYPNPFSVSSTVYFSLPESSKYSLEVYGINGVHTTYRLEGLAEAGELNSLNLNAFNLAGGIYLVRLTTNNQSKVLKLFRD